MTSDPNAVVVSFKTKGSLSITVGEPLSIRKFVKLLEVQPIPMNYIVDALRVERESHYDHENRQSIETNNWTIKLDWSSD